MRKIKTFLEKLKPGILIVVGMGILFDIFVSDFTSDLVILFFTGLWILGVWLYKFEGRVSVAGSLVFLSVCPFLLIFNKKPIAEKFAIWAYMFLLIGVVQLFVEYLKKERRDTGKDEK